MFPNPQALRRVLKEFKASQEFLHLVQPIHKLPRLWQPVGVVWTVEESIQMCFLGEGLIGFYGIIIPQNAQNPLYDVSV